MCVCVFICIGLTLTLAHAQTIHYTSNWATLAGRILCCLLIMIYHYNHTDWPRCTAAPSPFTPRTRLAGSAARSSSSRAVI